MAAAGEQPQEGRGLGGVGGLAEQAAAERDDGVGGEHHVVGLGGDGLGLGRRRGAARRRAAVSPRAGRLVDLGGEDGVGDDADLREQVAGGAGWRSRGSAAGASRPGHLKR